MCKGEPCMVISVTLDGVPTLDNPPPPNVELWAAELVRDDSPHLKVERGPDGEPLTIVAELGNGRAEYSVLRYISPHNAWVTCLVSWDEHWRPA